jgi:ribosomal-protein-alanine N-acetyltransferase
MIIPDHPSVTIRPMTARDIPQVLLLDKMGFSNPWPESAYRYEMTSNQSAVLTVLERADAAATPVNGNGKRGLLSRLFGAGQPAHDTGSLVGYCGYWHIAGEAHISTITVHPDWRGKKLGELLLWVMVRQALRDQAEKITLEVRVSNEIAQNLYRKYGMEIIGRRRAYYRDNNEDAYIMGVEPLDGAYREMIIDYGRKI